MAKQHNKKLTPHDMLDAICYNLSQFAFLEKKYQPALQMTSYDDFLNLMTSNLQEEAKKRKAKLKEWHSLKNKYPHRAKQYDELITRLSDLPYNIYQVADNKSVAKHIAKSLMLLGDFEVVLADQKTQARAIDSVGKTGLLGPQNDVYKTLLTHYREIHSIGPLLNTYTPDLKANQESVDLLISLAKPKKNIYHQIWINDHLMVKTTFETNKSLDDYFNKYPTKLKDLLYVISFAEEIDKKAGPTLTQDLINSEMKKASLEYTKKEAEHHLEQYSILALELFGQLIKKLKKNVPNISTSAGVFRDLNKIPGLKRNFTISEMDKMEDYRVIRDSLAHPTKFNLRPLGNRSQANNTQNILADFVSDMTEYLSILFNMDTKDVLAKINTHQPEEIMDVRALIALMDARKAFRDIIVKHENLPEDEEGVFKKTNIITKDENDILGAALTCRNTLCHGKIDHALAKQAEEMAEKAAPIINKIATAVNKKYGTSIQEHYDTTYQPQQVSVQNVIKEYPFLNTSFETYPDSDLFQQAFETKQKQSKETLDKKILLDLYTFAITLHSDLITQKSIQKTSFEQNDINPFISEIGAVIQTKTGDEPFKKLVVKGVLNAWLNGEKIPQQIQNSKA